MLCSSLPKKLYTKKTFHRASFSGEGASCSLWKNYNTNNPIFARQKNDLKRGFVTKKRMPIKPHLGSLFRWLGLVPDAHYFRAATSEHTTPRRNPVMHPSSRKGSTPYLKSMYSKRVQATFTPVLFCIITYLSSLFALFYSNIFLQSLDENLELRYNKDNFEKSGHVQ